MARNKFFYGWIVVIAAVLLVFLDGLLLYSFGILLPSIQEKYDLTKAVVNSIFSVRCLVFAVSMIVFGRLIDKHKPEKIIFICGVITALGLHFTAYSDSKITLFLNYAVLPGIGDGAFYIPAVAIARPTMPLKVKPVKSLKAVSNGSALLLFALLAALEAIKNKMSSPINAAIKRG